MGFIPPLLEAETVIGHCKMKRQLTILLIFLTFVACQNSTTKNELTQIEKFIIETDTFASNSKIFDQISNFIHTQKPRFSRNDIEFASGLIPGLLREQKFGSEDDTTGKLKDRVLFSIGIKEFISERQAAKAFWKIIEFHACCIPDKDVIKLKNFENLDKFKNSAKTTILSGNVVLEIVPANQMIVNEEITELLNEILEKRNYIKLEIGHGGPAIWTRK